jgi:nitroreductase
MEAIANISTRKSTRTYLKYPLEQQMIDLIFALASNAPIAHGKYDDYHLTAVLDEDALKEINEASGKICNNPNATYGAPVVIIISSKELAEDADVTNDFINIGCIAENMLLACGDLGLGSVPVVSVIKTLMQSPEIVVKLHIPDGFIPRFAIVCGYSSDKPATVEEAPRHTINGDLV